MAREAASDGDLDFKSDIEETVKEVDSHTMPHVVYVEPISTHVMDGSCIAPVETISIEANVEGNETTHTVGVPLSLPRTKDLPLPEITEANTESENEEPAVPAFTHVAAEISSPFNSCSPVCFAEKNIGLLADSNLTDLSCTPVVCSSEASPVKNDDANDSTEQASCHQEKSFGILAESADSNLEELCKSEVRAYGEAPATPVESEDGKESLGLASCHQEKSIGLLADSVDGNLEEALRTPVVGRSEVQAFGASLTTMLDAHSPVKSEDAKESIGQASCHQEESIDNQVGEASTIMSDPNSPVKSEDIKESIGQASFHQEKSIGNQVDEALRTMSDPHPPVKSEDAGESIGQASCHPEKSIGFLAELTESNLAELSCTSVVPGSEVLGFGEALPTILGVHPPVTCDDVKESIGQASCHQEKSIELLVEPADGNLELSSTQVVFRSDAQEFSEALPTMLDVQSPVKNDDVEESIGQASYHQEKSSGLLAEPEDVNLAKSQDVFASEVQEFGEALTTVVHAHSPMKSDDAKESIGYAADVTFAPREVSFGEGIGAEKGMNDDAETESKVSETFLQNLASDEYSDDQFPNNEPGILSENIPNDSLIVIGSSSAQKPNLLEDREPSSSKSFGEGCEIKDIVLEVAESLNTEVIVDDKDDNSLPLADAITMSGDEFGNVGVTDLDSVPNSMAGEVSVVNEGDTLPFSLESKFVEYSEPDVVCTQVVDAEPYESASKVEYVKTEIVDTQEVDGVPYESDSNFVDYTETEIHSTRVVNAGLDESSSKVEYVETEVANTQVVNAELYESASEFVEHSEAEVVSTQVIDAESYGSIYKFVEHTEAEVVSTQVVDAEPYESAISGDENFTDVIQYEDDGKSSKIHSTVGTSFSCRPVEDAEPRVFSSHFVATEPHESIDAIQSEGDEGAPLLCGASEHGGSRFTEVLPFGDGDKYNEGTQTVGGSFICESAEHSDGNATAVLATDDCDKCIEGTSSVNASISYGPTDESVKILTEVLPYEGDGNSNEITPTVGASISCGPTEHDTNILTGVLLSEDGDRCNVVTVTADASFSFGAAADGVGNIVEHDLNNLTDVLPDEGGDNGHEAEPADVASISAGPVDVSLPSRPAEEGVDNIIEQDLNNLTDVLPYEGADNKCNEVTTTVDSFSFGPAEDAVGNIIDQDLDNLTDVLPYEATPSYCASFSSRPAEEGVGNIIDQDSENLPDVRSQEGDDKCNEVTVTVDASSSGPAEDDVGNIMNEDLVDLPVVLSDEGDNKCNEATVTVDTSSSGPAEDVVGNIINQDLEDLPVVLPDEGDNKCNEATVTVDALSSGCAEDGVGNVIGQDLNNLTDELPYEGGYLCNEATVTVGASLPSRPAEEGGGIINDVLLYADKDKCGDVVPTVGESISSGPTEHGLENLSDVLPVEDDKNYNEVTTTVGASISCTPTEDVDGNFTDVPRYDVRDKSNDGTSTFGASSCGPVEHDVENLTDEPPHAEGYKSNEGTSPVGMSEDLQVTALGSPGGFDDSSVVEAMAGTTSKLRLDAKEEFALPSLSVDSQLDKHTETQVLSAQVADVDPYDSTIHGNIEVGDKCDEVTSYVGDKSEPAEVVEVTGEEDLDGSKISSDSNAMTFVTSEEELTMQAVNVEPEAVESIALEVSTTVEVTTVEVTTVEVTTVEVTTVEVTDVEDPGLKITSDSNVMAGATSEGELNTQVVAAEPSESTVHGNNDSGDNYDEVANYADALLSSGLAEVMEVAAVEDSALKTSSDLNVTTDAITVGELGMHDADAEPSETTTQGKTDSSFSPRLAEVVEVTAADDPGLEISSDSNVMAGVPSEAELSMQVADAEPFESAIPGNSEGSDKRNDVTSHVGTPAPETAEVVDVIAVEDSGLNISSDSDAAVGPMSSAELTPDSEE